MLSLRRKSRAASSVHRQYIRQLLTCPRSFDNCLNVAQYELESKAGVGEAADCSSLGARFHSWRDSPWTSHQVALTDASLTAMVLRDYCLNPWGREGDFWLVLPLCKVAHLFMIDADCAAQYTLPQTDLYKKTLVKINFFKCIYRWDRSSGIVAGVDNSSDGQYGILFLALPAMTCYAGWRPGMRLRRPALWWFFCPCRANSSFVSSLLSPSP